MNETRKIEWVQRFGAIPTDATHIDTSGYVAERDVIKSEGTGGLVWVRQNGSWELSTREPGELINSRYYGV